MIVISDRLTATGLKLGGLKNVRVSDEMGAPAAMSSVEENESMIIVTHSLAKSAWLEVERLRKQGKIVIELPDRTGGAEDEIPRLLKETIGFTINK